MCAAQVRSPLVWNAGPRPTLSLGTNHILRFQANPQTPLQRKRDVLAGGCLASAPLPPSSGPALLLYASKRQAAVLAVLVVCAAAAGCPVAAAMAGVQLYASFEVVEGATGFTVNATAANANVTWSFRDAGAAYTGGHGFMAHVARPPAERAASLTVQQSIRLQVGWGLGPAVCALQLEGLHVAVDVCRSSAAQAQWRWPCRRAPGCKWSSVWVTPSRSSRRPDGGRQRAARKADPARMDGHC